MSTGWIILIVMSFVALTDAALALYFRRLADNLESGAALDIGENDPAGLRRAAAVMLVFSPLLFLGAVLVAFGKIDIGIDPIQLGSAR